MDGREREAGSSDTVHWNEETPLHRAAWEWDFETLAALLAAGADPNARELLFPKWNPRGPAGSGLTPLHWAANAGRANAVAALLAGGANRDAQTSHQGITPLHQAAIAGKAETVITLLANKADPNIRDGWGRTPLFEVTSPGVVVTLLRAGADPNARDNDDRTPLHVQCSMGHPLKVLSHKPKPSVVSALLAGHRGGSKLERITVIPYVIGGGRRSRMQATSRSPRSVGRAKQRFKEIAIALRDRLIEDKYRFEYSRNRHAIERVTPRWTGLYDHRGTSQTDLAGSDVTSCAATSSCHY